MSRLLFAVLFVMALTGCQNRSVDTTQKGVVLLRYTTGSESTEQRERGFLETLQKEYPQIHILSSDQYSGTTPESSLDKAQQLLNEYGERIEGIFAVCEPNSNGVLGALKGAGLEGKVKFVGFDPSERLVRGMDEGVVHGIVLQDPVTMGHLAVKTMVAHLEGKTVERRVPTGEYVATPDNMKGTDEDGNDIAKLLDPIQFADDQAAQPETTKYRIAVIPKGTTHEFWKSVHAGAARAAREAGNVEIFWKGPIKESDREGQINVMQDFITQEVDGICLAPLDSQALVQSVRDAKKAGIPTVIFDSGLADEESFVSYVATDNYNGGALAAHRLAEALGHGK